MVAKYGVNRVDARRGVRFNLVFRGEGVRSCCHPSREHDALISSLLPILFLVCNNAKGVKNYVKETACEVESCTPRFELVNEACVLSSVNITATTKKSVSDLEALLNVIRELLGGNTFTFVLCCKQNIK